MLKEIAWRWIDDNKNQLIKICDDIWGFAEYGLLEYKSSKLIADTLEKHGFKVERGVAEMPTAFIAEWGNGGPIIGVMGEYDALPGVSNKVVPHREALVEGGMGHGCGHNIHGVSGMGAAIAVRYRSREE